MDYEKLKRQLHFEIMELPQYKFLDQDDINSWVETIIATQPDRALWHVQRLGQFGGSEIGPLVQAERNRQAKTVSDMGHSHQSDWDIFALKFLKKVPAPSDEFAALQRGTIMEPMIRELYHAAVCRQFNTTNVVRRQDLIEKITAARLNPKYSDLDFGRVQVDDILEVNGKHRILIDYKAPSKGGLQTLLNSEPLMYSSQVVLGKIIAERIGVNIDEVRVVPFDYDNFNFPTIEDTSLLQIPNEPDFEKEIIEVGNMYFDKLVKGEWPSPSFPKYALESSNDIPKEKLQTMNEWVVYREIVAQAQAEVNARLPEIESLLETIKQTRQDDFRMEIGPYNLTGATKMKFSKEKAVKRLEGLGTDPSLLDQIKNNGAKLSKALKQTGMNKKQIDLECNVPEYTVDFSATRSQEGEQIEVLKSLRETAQDATADVMCELVESLNELVSLSTDNADLVRRRDNQLKSLKRLTKSSESDATRDRANAALEHRSKLYSNNQDPNTSINPQPQQQEEFVNNQQAASEIDYIFSNQL